MFLPPATNTEILNRHISWVKKGYSFDDIQAIRRDIKEFFPYSPLGTRAIQQRIGGHYGEKEISRADLEKLTFLLVDDCDFDANLHFLNYTTNLESMFVSGRCSEKKINDLNPLRHLKKLEKLQLEHQEIEDISALSGLQNLREISLHNNPISTIKPLMSLNNIQKAAFSKTREEEVFELLQNSRDAKISFSSSEDDFHYDAFWMNNWAYKTTYFKDHSHIITTVEPLSRAKRTLVEPTAPENLRTMLRKSKEIAGALLGMSQKITSSEFSYREKSQLLKGYFEYQTSGAVEFDFEGSQN